MKTALLLLFLLAMPHVSPAPIGCSEYLPCWIAVTEMMDMLQGKDTERYNCSSRPLSDWYSTGQIHTIWGVYYITSGLIFQIISWPVIFVFSSQNTLTNMYNVFRVLAFIGVIECTEVWGVSIWSGVALLGGEVYCTNPIMATIVGKVTMVQWITGTTSAIFLGFHRLSDVTEKAKWFHNTPLKKALWFTLFTVYGVIGSVFYDTVLFNSRLMAPLLNPMISAKTEYTYSNEFLRYHNLAASVILIIVYSAVTNAWYKKKTDPVAQSQSWHTHRKLDNRVLIQSVFLSLTYVIPAISFVVIYFIAEPPAWLVLFSDLSYQLSGGLPFIMYICINTKVRKEFLRVLGIKQTPQISPMNNTNTLSTFLSTSRFFQN